MNLLNKYPIISDQITLSELRHILGTAEDVLQRQVPGDIVEFGCYTGTTSLFLQRLLLHMQSSKALHVYDSFEGLPSKTSADTSPVGEQFRAGELKATKQEFIRHFKQAGLRPPIIHKSWFSDLGPDDVPSEIAFAFLDGDFYDSILGSLRLIWPRLTSGAIVVIDDYQSEALPGAKRAVDEWLAAHPARLQVTDSLAILRL